MANGSCGLVISFDESGIVKKGYLGGTAVGKKSVNRKEVGKTE